MSDCFVVRNQLGHYWGKKKRWVDGSKPARVMTLKHRDEGLNLLVELSARDIDLRGEVIPVTASARGLPEVEPSEHRLQDEDDIAAALQEADGENGPATGEPATSS
jgi:hypothetical protein